MIELDGSTGEGGGQILRTALALAMCTGQPMAMRHIRARRPKPGLMRQHLACVQAAATVSQAQVEGAEPGSQELVFRPGPVRAGDYDFKVGTAGSCTLVLQTVLPALLTAPGPSTVSVSGGTHNPMAPPFHFLERSFAPLVRRLGAGLELSLQRLGFYPAGGGAFTARITPAAGALAPFDVLERGALRASYAECLAPGLPARVAARELAAVGGLLGWSAEQLRTLPARQHEGPGNALMLTLDHAQACEVFTAFGERGVSSEQVAAQAAGQVRRYLAGTGALGPCLADQWMLPLALAVVANGQAAAFTCTDWTGHASTNAQTIERFLPLRIEAAALDGGWRVTVAPRSRDGQKDAP